MKPSSSVPTNPNTDDCNMGSIPPLNTPTPGVSKHVRGVGKKTLGSFADDLATGGVLSNEDVKQAVDKAIASCGTSPEPSLFAMEDMEVVGETTFSLLRSSPVLNVLLPHIKRVVEAEHVSSARGGFVARTFRGRPGSVYAVRYWTGLAHKAALSTVLDEIREAWSIGLPFNPEAYPKQVFARERSPLDSPAEGVATRQGEGNQEKGPPLDGTIHAAVLSGMAGKSNPARVDAIGAPPDNFSHMHSSTNKGDDMVVYPKETPVTDNYLTKRKSLLRVYGCAAELDCFSRKANLALIAEWPGIGSLHDFLEGKTSSGQCSSQEDLVRWTRQAAEGLVQAQNRLVKGGDKPGLGLSTRNTYLFKRPKDEFQDNGREVFDVKVATFLPTCSILDADEHFDIRTTLPPEVFWAKPDACVKDIPSSPITSTNERGQGCREASDVWGMGALVFELATGRPAGPVPLAFRPLRDLLREVPIGPRFIYGDVARGVMRLALRRQPGDRARAIDIAAAVEEISTRTLRRAHTASRRQDRLLHHKLQAALLARDSDSADIHIEEQEEEVRGEGGDGYGKALAQWNIKGAVERAKGRARVFLRQLWFDSLSEDDKRRIRHRRRHQKANKKAKEWRERRVRAAGMRHWTSAEIANWASRLLNKTQILVLSSAPPTPITLRIMGGDGERDGEKKRTGNEESNILRDTYCEAALTLDSPPAKMEEMSFPVGATIIAVGTAGKGEGLGSRDLLKINSGLEDGDDKREEFHDDCIDEEADDGNNSSSVEGTADNDWASVEDAERVGYGGVEMAALTIAGGVNGVCVVEAMSGALEHAKDALMRFEKSSIRLLRPAEVKKKRIELVVRELLTIRLYSTSSQLKMRSLAEAVVRSAEAPRELTEDQISTQLPALARVLTAGYLHQVAMAEQGLAIAAARIQGLVRGKRIRMIVSSIWKQAEKYAEKVIRGEREARMKKEADLKAREKEEDLEQEKEEANRYRLRLVPRVVSVSARSMDVSLPRFLIAAARGTRRFLVVETTVILPLAPFPSSLFPGKNSRCAPVTCANNSWDPIDGYGADDEDRYGKIHVLLRQGSEAELEVQPEHASLSTATAVAPILNLSARSESSTEHGLTETYCGGATSFVRSVEGFLKLSGLRPSTTYCLTLEVPPLVRNDLLESARSTGLTEAVRSLEVRGAAAANNDDGGAKGGETDKRGGMPTDATGTPAEIIHPRGGELSASAATTATAVTIGIAPLTAHIVVDTLPDVPGVPRVICKVLTSASATDPRDPDSVLPLRQWQTPYPGVANMDGPSSGDYLVLAPGRPEPIVSLRWTAPEGNGLDICRYSVERRIGKAGVWKKIGPQSGGGSSQWAGKGGRRLPDAVDAPLRTVPLDILKKVAVQRLVLGYRVHAENTLGAGAPSDPVEVNLQAFLGHLRAQQGGGSPSSFTKTTTLARMSTTASLDKTISPLASTPISSAAVASVTNTNTLPSTPFVLPESLLLNEERCRINTEAAPGQAEGSYTPFLTSTAAFVDDFMGLYGFGEARVHGLFSPPSLSSRHQRAPFLGDVTQEEHSFFSGFGNGKGLCPLPSIGVTSGISGEKKGEKASNVGILSTQSGCGEVKYRLGDTRQSYVGGVPVAVACNGGEVWSRNKNNGVFHTFLDLGRRLPGRLRRDPEG